MVLPFDQQRAASLLALATGACFMTGQLGLALETATRATDLSGSVGGLPWLLSRAQLAFAMILTGNRPAGRQLIADVLADLGLAGPDLAMHLVRMLGGQALMFCEDYRAAAELLRSTVNNARAQGSLASLSYGLAALSEVRFRTGEWGQAWADGAEAVELAADFAAINDLGFALVCAARIEAAMGAAQECRVHLDRARLPAGPAGFDSIKSYAAAALGLLELGLSNYQRAVVALARAASLVARQGLGDPCVIQWRPDYIESLARTGRVAEAREQLAVLDGEAAATGSQWA